MTTEDDKNSSASELSDARRVLRALTAPASRPIFRT